MLAVVLALLIKTFLVQAFVIPSGSMEDTLKPGDRVLVNRLVERFHPPRRGDVIVLEDHNITDQIHRTAISSLLHWLTQGIGVTSGPKEEYKIKRVIGLPGETVEIDRCVVYIDGKPLAEPYVTPSRNRVECQYGPVRVPKESLFVLGDNRDESGDSRFGLGMIPFDKVVGRAFVIMWPPSRWGLLRGS